jgi:hypothetical protein
LEQDKTANKKVKITFDEYKKLSIMVIHAMKECERAGDENVQQQQIVDRLVKDIELNQSDRHTSVDRAEETMNKVNNVI